MHALRTSLFYVAVIGLGAAVIASTQVIEATGATGLRDRAIAVIDTARSRLLGKPQADLPLPQTAGADVSAAAQYPAPLPFDAPASAPPEVPARCSNRDTSFPEPVVIGDRLRLRFFERAMAALPPEDDPSATAERDIVFERLDLSGSYEVAADGTISLPLMGRVHVAAADLSCAEELAKLAHFSMTQSHVFVNAAFESRPQIVVRGWVRAPGAYGYAPGLTVGRLLAAAGAAGNGIGTDPTRVALAQRRNDLRTLEARAIGLHLERKRLEASLEGSPDLRLTAQDRDRVRDLLGQDRLEAERAALQAELADQAVQAARDQDTIQGLAARAVDLESQLGLADVQLRVLAKRRDELQQYKDRGMVLAQQLDGTVFDIMVSERYRRGILAELLEIRSAQRQARQAMAVNEAGRARDLTLRIRDLAAQSFDVAAQMRATRIDLSQLSAEGTGPGGTADLALTIDRAGASGALTLPADAATRLLPGDMLTVTAKSLSPSNTDAQRVSELDGTFVPIEAAVQE